MTIVLDVENKTSTFTCEGCGVREITAVADGVIPPTWLSGQLWIDLDVARQRQLPLCFCPVCAASITMTTLFSITPRS